MTLDQIAAIPKNFLTPADVAPYLNADPQTIRLTARDAPEKLLFPVVRCGTRTKIPKDLFVETFRRTAMHTLNATQEDWLRLGGFD